ncbi:TIGR03943 family putative permease subunit [Paraclostridium sordellii]|uniref:TIGR03943 family putative permease subunit n=1 Tax=Paraclostridium sordellii TaxID=1505 RepID=UPI0005DECAE4|nr:hypothetical protein [Paeniclostridium sordellii]CEN90166.1 conserved hypothetical protein [[Clostridium] sordellii] [Paeniclostridium sordellii]CEQ13475.1 conserved hypothetical protein [[Clostridium] sordellii] [Paeniclostridium sordellii]
MKVVRNLIIVLFLLLLTGCSSTQATVENHKKIVDLGNDTNKIENKKNSIASNDGIPIEIKEKMFIAQLDDIFNNSDDYIGRTIKIEGLYNSLEADGKTLNYVYRHSPGCCGNDGIVCIEFVGNDKMTMPNPDDWIEVTGKIERYKDKTANSVRIQLETLNIKTQRGAEFVSQ